MRPTTLEAILTLLEADPSVSQEHTEAIRRFCESNARSRRRRLGTAKEAAGLLNVHVRTLKRYASQGLLHPVRHSSRRVRYDLDEVERFVNEGRSFV